MDARPSFDAPEQLLAQSEWLARLARGLTASSDDAADLAQDTLAAALAHPPEPGRPLRPWLARVAHNLAVRRGVGRTRREAREERVARREELASTADIVERVAMQRTVVEAVLALDEPYRSTLLLRYWDDLAPRDIAERMSVPVETVRTRLKRAIAQLRERLDRRHGSRDEWLSVLLPIALTRAPAVTASVTTAGLGSIGALLVSTPMKFVLVATALVLAALVVQRAVEREAAPEVASAPTIEQLEPLVTPNAKRIESVASSSERAEVTAASEVSAPTPDRRPSIVCTVLDASTQLPIADAHVELRTIVFPDMDIVSLASAESDTEGVARLLDPRSQRDLRGVAAVEVRAPNYAALSLRVPEMQEVDGKPSPAHLAALLVRGTLVRGRVVASDGTTAVANASLRATRDPALFLEYELAGAPEIAVSDTRGAFTSEQRVAPRLRDSTMLFAVATQGLGWTTLGVVRDLELLDDVVVRLRPNAELMVSVRDAQGVPIEGAWVWAYPRFEPLGEPYGDDLQMLGGGDRVLGMFQTRTDANGLARLPRLPVDDDPTHATNGLRYTITVNAQDRREVRRPVTLDIARRTEISVVLETRELFRLHGIVSDRAGPIANASLGGSGVPGTSSDGVGAYHIECEVPQSRKLAMWIKAPGHAIREIAVQVAAGETERALDIDLTAGARLEGTVVDESGNPLAGFRPQIQSGREAHSAEPSITGDDGKFAFDGIEAKRWSLMVFAPHDGEKWAGPTEFVVDPAEGPLVLRFRRREPGRVSLAVELVDAATQQPVAATEATLMEEPRLQSAGFFHPLERALGRLTATQLSRGTWNLRIAAANGARAERTIVVDQDDGDIALRIELGTPGRIVGRVIFDDVPAEQRPDAAFLLTDPTHEGQWIPGPNQKPGRYTRGYAPLQASEGFAFRFDDVRAFDRVVLMLGPSPYYARAEVSVPAGGEVQVELHAKLGGALVFVREGKLKTATAALTLRCDGESDARETWLFIDDERTELGSFTVPAGRVRWTIRYWSTVNREQPAVIEGEAQIDPGATVRAPIRF